MELRQLEYFQMSSRLKTLPGPLKDSAYPSQTSPLRLKNLKQSSEFSCLTAVKSNCRLHLKELFFFNRIELALRNIQMQYLR